MPSVAPGSVLITGGGGLLAKALGRVLQREAVPVLSLTRLQCDVTRPDQLQAAFDAFRPTLVLNCAAWTRVDACEADPARANAINGEAVGIMAELCRRRSARLVHFSTNFVFNGQSDRPNRPDDPPDPLSAYGRSKRNGEILLTQVSPPSWLIVRTAALFDRHSDCFPQIVIERARNSPCLQVVKDQWVAPTFAPHLAGNVLELVRRGAEGIWHATHRGKTTWFDFAKLIKRDLALDAELQPVSTAQWLREHPDAARRPLMGLLDLRSTEAFLGRPFRPWRAGWRDYRTLGA